MSENSKITTEERENLKNLEQLVTMINQTNANVDSIQEKLLRMRANIEEKNRNIRPPHDSVSGDYFGWFNGLLEYLKFW